METPHGSATMDTMSRRSFVKAGSAIAASAAALSAFGCAPGTTVEEDETAGVTELAITNPEEGGEWVAAACWHNCGGRCMNKVMVKDGVVVRQKTDDTHEDSAEYPQQRGCVRGKAQQQQCFGADRLMHPLKRKGWQPGGGENSNGEMRGKDEWEVISWDEAISLACQEIKRISDEYGPTGFYCKSPDPTINLMCGCVRGWDTTSHGTYTLGCDMIGLPPVDCGKANDRFDLPNADYIILYSSNPTWSAAGTPTYYFIQAKESGTKFVSIDPLFNASAQMLDADWIPVRNGTDMAFMLATAYEMLRLDEEEGNIIDWDFLNTYTVGFDADHMPADAKIKENLKDYILGAYDDTPKTPEWAEPICGVKPEQVTAFARILGKENKTMLLHNYGMVRCNGAEMIPQMLMALGAMGGHMGKSGHATGGNYHADCGNYGPSLVAAGRAEMPVTENPVSTGVRQPQLYQLILNGGGDVVDVSNSYGSFHEPIPTTLGPIKGIFHVTDATLQTSLNQKEGIEAHRAVEFVLTRAQFMTTNALYSDIVLPVTTEWERVGSVTSCNREFVYCYSQVTEPIGEAKTDQEIGTLLLEGMGIDPALAYGKSEQQQFFEQIAGSTIMGDDGEMAPLVTITAEDIAEWGVDGQPQEGVVSLTDFISNGGYQYQRTPDDGHGYIGYADFVSDPVANPLTSASGKLEIYCQARYDLMASYGFPGIEDYKPYPTYVVPCVGYESTFEGGKIGGKRSEYPYLMYNPHYLRRSHSVFDNCAWLRETWGNPVFLNRDDAKEKGIAEGDTVLISTKAGQGLRRAAILDILMPGVVGVPHGAWVDVDEETGIDRAGSDNYLLGAEYGGFGVSGYNNYVCNIEKYDGEPIGLDCDVAPRLIAGATVAEPTA
ncbi:molybdopterin-dependent oxidoreductase [Adlercreutzia equolifaciens]|uniref:molybdopterin-dependent oxidoreductase n=1 Tax=Adlercreutzia equolifaciens TaxID=446660 RepID=UPI0023B0269A|nr:molybdopterin-dependent oxidoreductase [Adlercreutzia equolifaciens]MDE8702306.1 molybdopterin-dependent oxidoreductase [Adlercreutzia equolifaciens]